MGYIITAGQAAKLDYGLAQAEALSTQGDMEFERGIQALKDKAIIEEGYDDLQDKSRRAQEQARERQKRGGIGKLGGNILGFVASLAIPGGSAWAKAAKVLLPAIGGAAGKWAAGGFGDISVGDLDKKYKDQLTFFGDEGKTLEDAYEDLDYAIDVLDEDQKRKAMMDFGLDALAGLSTLKYDNLKVGTGENAKTLGELRKLGLSGDIDYKYKDYLRDIMNSTFGLEHSKTLEKLQHLNLEGLNVTGTAANPMIGELYNITGEAVADKPYDIIKGERRATERQLDLVDQLVNPESVQLADGSSLSALDAFGPDVTSEQRRLIGRQYLEDIDTSRGFDVMSQKEKATKALEKIFNPEIKDVDTLNQRAAFDPKINDALGKVIYEGRGLNQWERGKDGTVEELYFKANPKDSMDMDKFNTFAENDWKISKETVSWEEIQPFIQEAELGKENMNNPFAIFVNREGDYDIGRNQINTGWINKMYNVKYDLQGDQTRDPFYAEIQRILSQEAFKYGVVPGANTGIYDPTLSLRGLVRGF